MSRPLDKLTVELVGGSGARGTFDVFTSVEVVLDIYAPSEASFEMGDDGTWQTGASGSVRPGARYQMRLNGRPLLTGRVESNDLPLDASAGAVVRFTIRTKLADAMYQSADQKIAVKKTTLRDFLLALYAPLGYTEDDFVFNADVGRDLRTGRSTGKRRSPEARMARLTVEEARVSPPEPIYSAADRHLRRFGLMHWDGPDDTIIVGVPDQGMDPLYQIVARRRFGQRNNLIAGTLSHDYSSTPSSVSVYGTNAARRDVSRSRVSYTAIDQDVTDAGFARPVIVVSEQIRNREAAANAAARELSDRRQNKDKYIVECDGLSYWDGGRQVNYAQDTMASLTSDVAGGQAGNYYVPRAVLRRDDKGDSTHLHAVRAGLISLYPDLFEGGSATPGGDFYYFDPPTGVRVGHGVSPAPPPSLAQFTDVSPLAPTVGHNVEPGAEHHE